MDDLRCFPHDPRDERAFDRNEDSILETESTHTRLNQSFNHENELNSQILNNSDTIEFFRVRDGPDTQKERGKDRGKDRNRVTGIPGNIES